MPTPAAPNAKEWKEIHQNIQSTFASRKMSGIPEISPLHKNDTLGTPADSAICLRNSAGSGTQYVTFLIFNKKVVDSRLSVQLDRCEEQSYTPLAKP